MKLGREISGRETGLPEVFLGSHMLSNFDSATQLEWLVTNGLGGYASSTVLGINTRKYHGLLVAALNPPIKRHLLLAKLDEELWIDDSSYPFYSNEFKGSVYPEGYKRLVDFSLNPFPTYHYALSGLSLTKSIFMPYLKNAVIVHYAILNILKDHVVMSIKPLVNSRHFYDVTDRSRNHLEFVERPLSNGVIIESKPNMDYLVLSYTDGHRSQNTGIWLDKIYFRVDDLRGESFLDDYYQLGSFLIDIPPKERKSFYLVAVGGETEEEVTTDNAAIHERNTIERIYVNEVNRRSELVREFYRRNAEVREENWLNWLIIATNSFLVTRRSTGKKSVIAGYHWFEDWGRDALISLSGLTLVTGRFQDAEDVLLTFREYCRDGLIPSRFPDKEGDKPMYDSVDTTLWFFNAILQYLKYTGNFDFVKRELWETLQAIIEQHIHGTSFNIRLDVDGLLTHGPRLTWMDVSIDGKPVTPREGKAVEIQALWYNTLKFMEVLAAEFDNRDDAQRYHNLAVKAKESFNEKFCNDKADYLFDKVNGNNHDSSLRPNQVIAVSLDFPMLDNTWCERIVETVWRKLWGTYGLRSLSEDDPRYIGKYVGGLHHRDSAYHNGTVWAWLLGPFVTAFLKVKNHDADWRSFVFNNMMRPLLFEGAYSACIGTLSEIFDGDPPHHPRGCISQAWSVAEPLRAYVEDILLRRPPHENQIMSLSRESHDNN